MAPQVSRPGRTAVAENELIGPRGSRLLGLFAAAEVSGKESGVLAAERAGGHRHGSRVRVGGDKYRSLIIIDENEQATRR